MSFSIPPPNLRLIRAQTTPAAGMPHEYTSSAHTTNSRNLSPLRPLPTPPSSASVHSSRRSGSIRPLPSLPPSRCTTPEPKQPSSGPHHARNGSYSSMCSSSSSVEVTTLSKAAVHKDLSIIPLSLRPAVRQNIGQTSNSYHQSPSSSRRPTSREKLSFACSSSRVSQPIYKKKRPQLHIKIEPSEEEEKPPVKLPDLTIPIPKRQSSLDSLTLRTPSFLSPDQALSPVISRRRRKSSQPASSMMLLSMAIRDANANAKQLRTYPEVAAEKRTSLQDSDDDELCSLDNGSSLVFDLSASPEGAQFLHFKKGASPKCGSQDDNFHRFAQPPSSPAPFTGSRWAAVQVTNVVHEDDVSSDSEAELEVSARKPAGGLSSLQDLEKSKARPRATKQPAKATLFRLKQASLLPTAPTVTGVGAISRSQERRRSSKIASRMWFKEKGGKRWEERDLHEVLSELRKLR